MIEPDYHDVMEHFFARGEKATEGREPYFIGGVYAKEIHLNAGEILISHKHAYDHMSILASGVAMLTTPEGETRLEAPRVINVKAGVHHGLRTITPCVWYCIHAVDTATEAYKNQDMDATDGMLIIKRK